MVNGAGWSQPAPYIHPIIIKHMNTVLEQLIDELNNHLKYDDDLTPEVELTLISMINKCKDRLTAEKIQLHEAFEDGYAQGYNQGKVDGWKKSLNTNQ